MGRAIKKGSDMEKIIAIANYQNATIGFGMIEEEAGKLFCTHVLVNGSGIIGK
jgi:hypothetical protein